MLAKQYFDRIDVILRKLSKEQADMIVKAAEMIVDAALTGGKFWVYDKGKAVSSEVVGRAGGLLMTQLLTEPDPSTIQKGDVLAVSAVKNNDPSDTVFVEKAKAKGVKTMAVLPFNNPSDTSENLQEKVDLAVDDYAESGDGCLEVEGYVRRICPTTGVTNAAIMWAVCAEVVDELRRRGKEAHIYKSVYRVGNVEWNTRMRDEFLRTGY